MDTDFSNLLTARLTALTEDLRFYHKPSDTLIAPQIVGTMLPERDNEYQEGDEFPLVRWAIFEGGFAPRRPQPFKIVLSLGIYTNGTIDDGNADILTLTRAVGAIVGDRSFPPARLNTPIPFTIGDPREGYEGLQPHPYYYARMVLDFTTS